MKPSQERLVDLSATAHSEDPEAGVFLDSLKEIIDLDVGVTVVAIVHIGAFAKERIRFVEKEDRTAAIRRSEDASQILLRLANIFRDNGAQIDAVQVFSQIASQSLGGEERAHPVFAGEQDANAFWVRQLANGRARCFRTALCAHGCDHLVQRYPKTGRQAQLGFDPVLRIKKDFLVSIPDPISFEPFPFALRFAELLSLLPDFFHRQR